MAIALVQKTSTTFGLSSSQQSLAWTSNVTTGNLLLIAVYTSGTPITVSVTDTIGNTYTQISSYATASNVNVSLWYCVSSFSGANTAKITPSGLCQGAWGVLEYSGVAGSPLDGSSSHSSAISVSSWTTGNIPVSGTADLVVGVFGSTGANSGFSPGSGFTLEINNGVTTFRNIFVEDRLGVSAALAATGTVSLADIYGAVGASFLAAPAPFVWFPTAIKFREPLPEPEPWYERDILSARLIPAYSGPIPWIPLAVKFMPGPEPDPPEYRTRLASGALLPGFTGPVAWIPSSKRVWQGLGLEPDLVEYRTRLASGALLPGYTGPVIVIWFPRPTRDEKLYASLDPWGDALQPTSGRRWSAASFPYVPPTPGNLLLVPVDQHAPPRSRRHQQIVADIINSMLLDGTLTNVSGDYEIGYTATSPANWGGSPPLTVNAALDRLAAAIIALGKVP